MLLDVAIVGMGGMGRIYLQELSRVNGVRINSIVSNSFSKVEAEALGLNLYRNIEDMLDVEHPDLSCVCTPSFLHTVHISKLLTAGIHVIAEKPLALTSNDARNLFELATKQEVYLFPAYVVRFSHSSVLLKKCVKQGCYGQVLDVVFSRLSPKPFWNRDGWVVDADKSGLIPFDLHIHDLDLMICLFGSPNEATIEDCAFGSERYSEHCRFRYRYKTFSVGAEAAWFNVCYTFSSQWRVCFQHAVVESKNEVVRIFTENDVQEIIRPPDVSSSLRMGINVPVTDMYYKELQHFVDCVKDNRESEIVSESEIIEGIRVLEQLVSIL